MHIALFVQLALGKHIVNVPRDNRPISLKQLSHLRLREPYRIVNNADIKTRRFIRLINNHFVLGFVHRLNILLSSPFLHTV